MNTHTDPWRRTDGKTIRTPHPDLAADLRRKRGRELADFVLACADWATPEDRQLLKAVYADNMNAVQIARLSGSAPRAVRRRVRKIIQRFLDPRFAYVMQHRHLWNTTRRRVATACVLQGRTLRGAARHLDSSLHTVRKEMHAVEALFQAHALAAERPKRPRTDHDRPAEPGPIQLHDDAHKTPTLRLRQLDEDEADRQSRRDRATSRLVASPNTTASRWAPRKEH